MADVQIWQFEDRQIAAQALAVRVAGDLTEVLQQQENAALVVSGGSSPKALFGLLRKADLDWQRVWVVPSDERVVATDHADSNAGMIQNCLIRDQAASARQVSLLPDALGSLDAVAQRLKRLPWPLAHVVLGMGNDGHTASLFPTAPDIANTLNSTRRVVLQNVPGLASQRVSLTVHALLEARAISLLVFGQDKREILDRALAPGSAAEFPVRAILHQTRCPVEVYWAP